MSWTDIFRRKARATAKQLAPEAIRLAQSNQDKAFDEVVKLAAKAAGIEVDATEVRLTVAAVRQEMTHQALLVENARHEAAMARIKERFGK